VAYREGRTDELNSVAWVRNVLDDEIAARAGRFLTTRSYQFTADVAAVGGFGRGFRRSVFVFDMTGDEPIVVYRRDRTHLGWPLGTEIRNQLISGLDQQGLLR
jgi:hypothetical protein